MGISMKNKKALIVMVLVGSLFAGALLGYKYLSRDQPSTTGERGINSVDYGGPTKEEQQAGDKQKEATAKREEINKSSTQGQQSATVSIVDSSQYGEEFEIRAFVSNVFEEGGTCTATLTKAGNATVTRSSATTLSAKTTQCLAIEIPVSTFGSKGDWDMVISYASPTASGSTMAKKVTIQ